MVHLLHSRSQIIEHISCNFQLSSPQTFNDYLAHEMLALDYWCTNQSLRFLDDKSGAFEHECHVPREIVVSEASCVRLRWSKKVNFWEYTITFVCAC